MGGSCLYESRCKYTCPCGYEFIQTDNQDFRKLKTIRRLHAKRCELGRKMNKDMSERYEIEDTKGLSKESVKQGESWFGEELDLHSKLLLKNPN